MDVAALDQCDEKGEVKALGCCAKTCGHCQATAKKIGVKRQIQCTFKCQSLIPTIEERYAEKARELKEAQSSDPSTASWFSAAKRRASAAVSAMGNAVAEKTEKVKKIWSDGIAKGDFGAVRPWVQWADQFKACGPKVQVVCVRTVKDNNKASCMDEDCQEHGIQACMKENASCNGEVAFESAKILL